jgi:hypothetical protein
MQLDKIFDEFLRDLLIIFEALWTMTGGWLTEIQLIEIVIFQLIKT